MVTTLVAVSWTSTWASGTLITTCCTTAVAAAGIFATGTATASGRLAVSTVLVSPWYPVERNSSATSVTACCLVAGGSASVAGGSDFAAFRRDLVGCADLVARTPISTAETIPGFATDVSGSVTCGFRSETASGSGTDVSGADGSDGSGADGSAGSGAMVPALTYWLAYPASNRLPDSSYPSCSRLAGQYSRSATNWATN